MATGTPTELSRTPANDDSLQPTRPDGNSLQPTRLDCDPTQPNRVWRFCRRLARVVFPVWFRFKARGLERIPQAGAALLVINHQSFLDPLLVGVNLSRPISYLARDSLFRVPFIGWILRNTYVMPVNRQAPSSSSLRLAADRLSRGFLVAIFPEGTRSNNGKMGPLKPGFIVLLRRADVPVIPVGVAGTGAAMPRGSLFPRPKACRVVFGEPIPRDVVAKLAAKGNEEALLHEVRRHMSQCQQEAEEWLTRRVRGR